MAENILDQILRVKDVLPKKQQKLCNFLVMNCEQVGIMTVAELAREAEVGTTTVMRLIETLGCSSFGEFKKELLNCALTRNISSYHSMKRNIQLSGSPGEGGRLHSVVSDSLNVLENLCTPANVTQFNAAVELLAGAERIFTLGLRSSESLALYCQYAMSTFHPNVVQLSRDSEYIFDRITLSVRPSDVMLIFSVWPCTRKTIEAAELSHRKGIPMILITNTSLNPIVKYASVVIDTNSVNHISGRTVIMAVAEALVSELGHRLAPASAENIERVEAVLSEKNVVLQEY